MLAMIWAAVRTLPAYAAPSPLLLITMRCWGADFAKHLAIAQPRTHALALHDCVQICQRDASENSAATHLCCELCDILGSPRDKHVRKNRAAVVPNVWTLCATLAGSAIMVCRPRRHCCPAVQWEERRATSHDVSVTLSLQLAVQARWLRMH